MLLCVADPAADAEPDAATDANADAASTFIIITHQSLSHLLSLYLYSRRRTPRRTPRRRQRPRAISSRVVATALMCRCKPASGVIAATVRRTSVVVKRAPTVLRTSCLCLAAMRVRHLRRFVLSFYFIFVLQTNSKKIHLYVIDTIPVATTNTVPDTVPDSVDTSTNASGTYIQTQLFSNTL